MNFTQTQITALADKAIKATRLAGDGILLYYKQEIEFSFKIDNSPITIADKSSHQILLSALADDQIPLISEEADQVEVCGRYYWLVDPLDGTKDFIAHSDEFTVNVALMEDNKPIVGVLYAPALDELYVGIPGVGIWMEKSGARRELPKISRNDRLRMATSRFHDGADLSIFADANNVKEYVPIGSALKFGRVAFSNIDIYPRLIGTYEWDTAAGHAILRAAGGDIVDWKTGKPLVYGKSNRLNSSFFAFGPAFKFIDFKFPQ